MDILYNKHNVESVVEYEIEYHRRNHLRHHRQRSVEPIDFLN